MLLMPKAAAWRSSLQVRVVPVDTMAIGKAGAINAALLAVSILGTTRPDLRARLRRYRLERAQQVMDEVLE